MRLFVLLLVFITSSNYCFSQAKSLIFDIEFGETYKNYKNSAARKRSKITFESGATATNCYEYWKNRNSAVRESFSDSLYRSEYLACDVFRLLSKDKVEIVDEKNASPYLRQIYNRLDLRSFPSSLAQQIEDENKTFSSLAAQLKPKFDKHSIVSETEDWNFVITLIAETDVNKNGKRDVILWLSDESKAGIYRAYETLIIFDFAKRGKLKAVKYK